MTTTPATQAILPVTPEDREAAGQVDPANRVDYKIGRLDGSSTVQAFARHRKAHSLPGDVATDAFEAGWVAARDYFQVARGIPSVDPMRRQAAEYVAALTPSALSGDAGEGE